jgi:hypothetical protein
MCETLVHIITNNRYKVNIVLGKSVKYWIVMSVILIWQVRGYGQGKTDIYIPLDGRHEIRLAPKVDTLVNEEEYIYKLTIDPQYQFAELFCERGLAVKVDNFLHITPTSKKQGGMDTLTIRIILFSNHNRILLYKHIFVKAIQKTYPKTLKKQVETVVINNLTLERNLSYSKDNFRPKSVFSFATPENIPDTAKKVLSVTISLINKAFSKSYFIKGDQITQEVMNEIKKQKQPTQTYVRLDIRVGKKVKSVWTRFTMETGGKLPMAAL